MDGAGGGGGAFGGLTLRIVDNNISNVAFSSPVNLLTYLDTPYDPDLGRQTLIPNSIYYFKNIPKNGQALAWIRLPFDGTYNGGVTPQRGDKIIVESDDVGFFNETSGVGNTDSFLIGTQIPPLNTDPQLEVYIGRRGDMQSAPGLEQNVNSSYANILDLNKNRYFLFFKGQDDFFATNIRFTWIRFEFECIEDFANDGRVMWLITSSSVYSAVDGGFSSYEATYYE
jgi:hypothetical protein